MYALMYNHLAHSVLFVIISLTIYLTLVKQMATTNQLLKNLPVFVHVHTDTNL